MAVHLRRSPAEPAVVFGASPIVVLVGDGANSLDMFVTCLESHGIWAAQAAPTVAGLRDLEALQPAVVVIDLGTPSRRDDVRTLRTVLHAREIRHTPAIVLACSTAQAAAVATGREVCLLKPVLPMTLLDRIQKTVRRGRTTDTWPQLTSPPHEVSQMRDIREVINRLRAEYIDMPDLRLTQHSIERLCGIEHEVCEVVIDMLLRERFLSARADGTYVRHRDVSTGLKPSYSVRT